MPCGEGNCNFGLWDGEPKEESESHPPRCTKCGSERWYFNGSKWKCSDCGHSEWLNVGKL